MSTDEQGQTTKTFVGGIESSFRTEQSLIPVVSPLQMERATKCYRLYSAEKDFKTRSQYAADWCNCLGFHTGLIREARIALESDEAKRTFGEE